MPHIDLNNELPGILGLMEFRPLTAGPLNQLAETLLRGDNVLPRGDRELIAAFVSHLNRCEFCEASHSAFASKQLSGGAELVTAVKKDLDTAPISDKMKALLKIAELVHDDGHSVTAAHVAAAHATGATDTEVHDTVLIAAAFCMFNRYVDGLATTAPHEASAYESMADRIVTHGYMHSVGSTTQ